MLVPIPFALSNLSNVGKIMLLKRSNIMNWLKKWNTIDTSKLVNKIDYDVKITEYWK